MEKRFIQAGVSAEDFIKATSVLQAGEKVVVEGLGSDGDRGCLFFVPSNIL